MSGCETVKRFGGSQSTARRIFLYQEHLRYFRASLNWHVLVQLYWRLQHICSAAVSCEGALGLLGPKSSTHAAGKVAMMRMGYTQNVAPW